MFYIISITWLLLLIPKFETFEIWIMLSTNVSLDKTDVDNDNDLSQKVG